MAVIIEREASQDDPIYEEPVTSYRRNLDLNSFRSTAPSPSVEMGTADAKENLQAAEASKK